MGGRVMTAEYGEPIFDRFDIAEAFSVWCHDYADASDPYWLAKSAQLHRLRFRGRPTLRYETLSLNSKAIYAGIEARTR
jgi:hypothetical protein